MPLNEIATNYSRAVDNYEAGRPDYPAELVSALPLSGAHVVVELGAGTGKLTRLMLPHLSSGAILIAVEPLADMAAKIAKETKVSVVNRSASDTGLEDASADIVVCAQAFHWFDDEASVAEIARILRQHGALALIWNVRDESVAWVRAISHLIDDYAENTPRYNTGRWQWILRDPRFSFDKELIEENPHTVLRDGIYDRVLSTSFIAKMSDTEKQNLRLEIGAILDAHGLRGATKLTMPYVSRLFLLTRR